MGEARLTVLVPLPDLDEQFEPVFRDNFTRIDANHDCSLDKEEFGLFLQMINRTENTKYVFDIVDVDHINNISFAEFMQFAKTLSEVRATKNLRPYLELAFKSCDDGQDGLLTQKELEKFLLYVGHKVGLFKGKEVFKKFDANGDGLIDLDEIMARFDLKLAE
jgi:Ca2+-binding EF-hand superfamily protein